MCSSCESSSCSRDMPDCGRAGCWCCCCCCSALQLTFCPNSPPPPLAHPFRSLRAAQGRALDESNTTNERARGKQTLLSLSQITFVWVLNLMSNGCRTIAVFFQGHPMWRAVIVEVRLCLA